MKLLKNAKGIARVQSKAIIAMLLLVIMVFSSLPLEVIAQQLGDSQTISDTITTVTMGGEEMIIGADGSFLIPETTVTVTYHDLFDEVGIGYVTTQSLPRGEPDYISINPINIYFQGEEHVLSENDTILVDLYDDGIIVEHPVSRYRWLDGERLRIDDPRIGNLVPVIPHEGNEIVAFAEGILPMSAFPPIQGEIAYIWQTYQPAANVGMGAPWNITVQARRYTIIINAVEYELFCADPMRPGPENTTINAARWGAFGQLTEARWLNALRYGFPNNLHLHTNINTGEEILLPQRLLNVYTTRIAVAMARHGANAFNGNQTTRTNAEGLINGTWPANRNLPNPILVNGEIEAEDRGRVITESEEWAISESFDVTHLRVTNTPFNPFQFEWGEGTPAGAELWINGNQHIGTAPNMNNVLWYAWANAVDSFEIRMPNTEAFANQDAWVRLIGVNEAWAGRVFLLRHEDNTATDINASPAGGVPQDLIFYIPSIRASATFNFITEATTEEYGSLRIFKHNPQGQPLQGAVFSIYRLDDPNSGYITGSPFTTNSNGIINVNNLLEGDYRIREIQAPANHTIVGDGEWIVTIEENHTSQIPFLLEVENIPSIIDNNTVDNNTITNNTNLNNSTDNNTSPPVVAPPGAVRIQKICALGRYNIPDALIRIEGRSAFNMVTGDGQLWSINNTGIDFSIVLTAGHTLPVVLPQETDDEGNPIGLPPVEFDLQDGVLTIYNLPWGYFRVQEERAPDSYSLLPQHTAFSFWHLPPDVMISGVATGGGGNAGSTTPPTDGGGAGDLAALIQALYDGELAGPADGLEPAPPTLEGTGGGVDFIIDEDANVNSILITFENYPFSEIIVYKHCRETNQPLANAHIRIEGFFVEGNAPVITNRTYITDANGRVVFTHLPAGGYTISELQPPPGFLLDSPNFQHVSVSWGQRRYNALGQALTEADRQPPVVRFYNTPFAYIEVIKVDGDDASRRLSGAVFSLTGLDQHGNIVTQQATTDANGVARWDNLIPGAVYVLEEISPPTGFIIQEGITTIIPTTGRNEVTWRNWVSPGLTIIKLDYDTGLPLAGAVFEVTPQGTGSPIIFDNALVTDINGRIFIPNTLLEGVGERVFLVREVLPPPGFTLSDNNVQTVTMIAGANNNQTVTFYNRRYPDITIIKTDSRTNLPIQGAVFSVERLSEPNRGYVTGSPFTTDRSGRINIPQQSPGQYRIVEIRPANGFWLDPMEQNRSTIINLLPNEDYIVRFENTLLPTLIITKFNQLTHRPVPLTHFRVEFEQPNSPHVEHVGDFVTDRNGQIILPLVSSGWYRITEIRPAPEMSLNSNNSYRTFLRPGDYTYTILSHISHMTGIVTNIGGGFGFGSGSGMGVGSGYPLTSNANIPNLSNNPHEPSSPNPNDPVDINPIVAPNFPFSPSEWENMSDTQRQAFFQNQITIDDGTPHLTGTGVWNFPLNAIVVRKICSVTGQLLPNAEFALTHISAGVSGNVGTVIGTFRTNSSGILVITGLVPGTYAVEETRAPNHFTLSANNTQHAWLQPDNHSIVMLDFVNDPYGSLLITKRCEVTRQPLMNAVFRVTRSDGSVVGTSNGYFTTDLEGQIFIPNLAPDSFIVTEVQAPDGFRLSGTPRTIRVNATSQTYRLDFTNQPYSTLIIQKFDNFNNDPIQGAHFEVRHADGRYVGSFITDQDGLIRIPAVLGWFQVTETQAPVGFALDPNPTRLVHVRPQAPELVRFFNARLGSLIIEKVDQHGTPLAGAQFRVSQTTGAYVSTHTTNASGLITLTDLTAGFYFVEETRPPAGFLISQAGQHVQVSNNAATAVTFMNLEQPTLTIVKTDEAGNPLSGARFRVAHIGGSFREYITTGQGGVASLTVPVGTLEVVEVQAPTGFVITESARTVVSRAGVHRTETFINHRIPSLVIEKVDINGNPLSGAEFEIRRVIDNGLVQRVVTNNAGIATIAQLDPGTYQVLETRAPAGFVLDNVAQIVTVTAGDIQTLRFVNERIPSLTIQKVDGDGNPLQGAEFEIRTIQGTLIETVTTNIGGLATIANLPTGVFEILETRAPAGFEIIEHGRIIEVFAGQTRIERFVNLRSPGLIIEKVDGDGNPLSGAEFEVRTMDGALIQRVTTGVGGTASVAQIAPGMYQVTETRPPAGFVLDSLTQNVEVRAGENATLRFVNHREPSLVIEKVDGSGLPLAGATFEVRTLAGALVTEVVTNQGGTAIVTGLTTNAYEIIETIPPTGYVIVTRSRVIEFVAGQTVTTRFVNLRQPGLVIEKVNSEGLPLANATFELRDVSGALIERVVTGQGGIAVIENLPTGTFTLTETIAPQGYMIVEEARVIEFVAGVSRTERFINLRQPSLVIEKVDNAGNPLSGAEFELRRPNGELVARVVTSQGGIANITGLETGTYIIEETRAPFGFVITEPARTIQFTAGQARVERFVNYRQPSLIIEKVNTEGLPLANATFELRDISGSLVERFVTGQGGIVVIENLPTGTFTLTETIAPQGYMIVEEARVIEFVAGVSRTERFINLRQPSLVIEKVDNAGNPLSGAEFELRRPNGELVARVVTSQGGIANITGLETGTYIIEETRAPNGFVITESARTIEFTAGQARLERFVNYRQPSLIIEKVDDSGNPLSGAEFELRTLGGELIVRGLTNQGGLFVVEYITPGAYTLAETRPPHGFAATESARAISVVAGQTRVERFVNYRLPSLIIEKVDTDGNPLAGAEFEIRTLGGELINRSATNQGGLITIPYMSPGSYQVLETRAPSGFVVTEPARAIEISAGQTRTERFINHRAPSLIIEKVDSFGNPLSGATFEVRTLAGLLVERLVTGQGGMAIIDELPPGSYEIIETIAPDGFALIEGSRAIQIVAGQTVVERFVNPRLATLVIQKVDGVTGEALQGVAFEVTALNGDRWANHINNSFEFITDNAGMIRLPNLPTGTWVIIETRPLAGYMATEPVVFAVGVDNEYLVTIRNYRYPDYVIRKIDGVTGEALAGVQFEIARYFADGRVGSRLRNPIDGSFIWTTDNAGLIRIPNLEHGTYVAVEVRPLLGYQLAAPVIFVVDDHEPTTITIHNYRYSEWNIRKLSGDTGLPLAGVVFEVTHFYGTGTTGERLRNAHDGSFEFVTNQAGIAHIGPLSPGSYLITETRSLEGYVVAEPVIINVTGREVDTTITIRNYKMATYVIRKISADTGEPLQGVVFEIANYFGNGNSGERIRNPIDGSFEFVTNQAGLIHIPNLPQGVYVAIETRALAGYAVATPVVFVVGDNQDTTITIRNYKQPSVVIRKIDGDTNQPLAGVEFEIAVYLGNGRTGQRLKNYAFDGSYTFTTDSSGHIYLPTLLDGRYIVIETRPLPGYILASPVIFTVGVNGDHTVIIRNFRYPDFAILKIDGDTNQPLSGVEFEIAHYLGQGRNGERLINPANLTNTFVTDEAGLIHLPSMPQGMFIAIETRALAGYSLADPVIFTVGTESRTITIRNFRQPSVVIRKIDGDTGQRLAGVEFEIINYQTGQRLKNYVADNSYVFITDTSGHIYLPFLPDGRYLAVEIRPLPGYQLAVPVPFTVGINGDHTVIIRNYRYADFAILKVDGVTGQPLAGVAFEISHYLGQGRGGELLINPANNTTTFITNANGLIHLPAITQGSFIATETRALAGYRLATPVVFTVESDNRTIVIENFPYAEINILKLDGHTGQPQAGVVFEISHYYGGRAGHRLQNPVNGTFEFTTDNAGLIRLGFLADGTYIITEVRPLAGFIAAEPVIFVVGEGSNDTTITIRNYSMANLSIRKINSVTRAPLAGVVFEISRIDGTRLINPATGFHDFITDANGLIHLPVMEDGRFYLRETRALPGFMIDHEIIAFNIDSSSRQRDHVLVVENTPASGLLIVKTDAQTGRPLAGVEFEVRHADGRLVTPQILDGNQPNTPANSPQLTATGGFITDASGRINLNHLTPGIYHVREVRALPGFELDTTVHVVTVMAGQQAVLEVANVPLGGVRLLKVCAFTERPLHNVEFMVFDRFNNVVGVFHTDNNGLIDFSGILVQGRYTLRETRPANGFFRDDVPRTIEIVAGRVTEITWTNIPYAGQIQILKVSADFNEINGLPAGTPLQGAIFEIRDQRTGNLVDRIISDHRGMAVSRPLPLGRYIIEEVQAPRFYSLNNRPMDVTIEFATQIIRLEFANASANVGVSVTKTGPQTVMPGQNHVVYEIRRLRNDSTVPLYDFFFREILPTDAFRVERIVTGTFNHSLRYRVQATTNTGRVIIVNDNIMTTRNNVLDMRPAALGLANNEFITEVIFIFGHVPAGFSMVESPRIEGRVLNQTFPDGFQFANRVDVGGRHDGEWIVNGDTVVTTILVPSSERIPQTGQ